MEIRSAPISCEGKVWIADFIFTNCKSVCIPMSQKCPSCKQHSKEQEIEVEFVSFTVDPDIDTPKVLKEYLSQFSDDESNWHLLTGYSQEAIEKLAIEPVPDNCAKTGFFRTSHPWD